MTEQKHGTSIQWTHGEGFKGETWNPVTGCSHVSPGCMGPCYAEVLTARFAGQPGWIEEHKPWTAQNAAHNVRVRPERLDQPLRWKKPRMIFVNSMSDLFHEQIPDAYIEEVFAVMAGAPQHVFQILTKRPERAREWFGYRLRSGMVAGAAQQRKISLPRVPMDEWWPLANVWLGVSIESARFNGRADVLREIPAAVRFISAEPLLGSLFPTICGDPCYPTGAEGGSYRCGLAKGHNGRHASRYGEGAEWGDDMPGLYTRLEREFAPAPLDLTGIDWVIAGGCSGGRESKPMHPEWAREILDACLAQCEDCKTLGAKYVPEEWQPRFEDGHTHWAPCSRHTAFFFKQWGSWLPYEEDAQPPFWNGQDGKTIDGHMLPATLSEHEIIDGWWSPDPENEPIYYYAGAAPKAGGRLLDGREWNEMPR